MDAVNRQAIRAATEVENALVDLAVEAEPDHLTKTEQRDLNAVLDQLTSATTRLKNLTERPVR